MKKNRNSTLQNKPTGEVRVIAGLWRGRKLPVLNTEGLRPTTDRVKETLFNWLMNDVAGSRCLDCFAGSGSLGIEALSRQAQAAVFLEKFANAANLLKNNLTSLKTTNGTVINTDTLQYLAQKNSQPGFEVVFVDPPFNHGFVPKVLTLLAENHWLADNALIYVETEKNHPPLELPSNWQILKEKTAGQVISRLIQCL
ncbi:16S rRNA (guanine(966)-N(2))-methyltransferase RsmD [Actinobacillus pleuropneumoniae]|uniref:Ribosomal RNA small subunit methyltransferase D n=1 Tax=Actinobacillus pleuropneumoniae TaxID=715 RepID=A0ABM6X3M1_ACTPL|nr:16S rRNA (guanine(966)-N(2))-methyltransferase RsmD [Actinobacillus pleuropneumoniae]ASU15180.1 Ribosomal RNA small subunit methyltransferase D [Actinobacillus pleuropneumoniae]AWG95775.1 16S rRNA (guanine(966)-N(2))-methyltransferase RsmD [Actinobacillus pleuropneumoniae serovar 1 str. 4074]AXA21845.1 16S rRNA (guanine(966)-N(2))-methyltransferase RsmD [Actinobacillus pleuropneumoniae]EFM93779.1 Ribosomal RNA small subunit methyltransferase D [Actinobacillus pleuropneumoniae serovar 9 str. 